MEALSAFTDGGGCVEGLAQRLAGLDVHRVGLLGVFFRDLRKGRAAGQEQGKNAERRFYSCSPHGSISVRVERAANSGAKASMICCGSGHSCVSVMTPNCTPPP